jgi:hypothetical protein
MKTAHDYMLEAFGPEWSGKVWDMDRLKVKVERAITEAVIAEREALASWIEQRTRRMGNDPLPWAVGELLARDIRTPAKGEGK